MRVPARVAGVARIVMVTPASGGKINPLTLAAAKLAGISEIYRVGGAQAVAALAYGTATIAPVDKIVGPGNAYVAAAKRLVFGRVGIDSIAGPSEILVVADGANDPAWIAADLLSQAEHDASSQSILITDDADFADKVAAAVEAQLKELPRREIAEASWRAHGAIIVVGKLDDAAPLVDRDCARASGDRDGGACGVLQPCEECGCGVPGALFAGSDRRLRGGAEPRAADLAHGAVLLGPLGARFHEAHLGAVVRCGRTGQLGPAALALAKAEGLAAHGRSIAIRLNRQG